VIQIMAEQEIYGRSINKVQNGGCEERRPAIKTDNESHM